MSAAGGLHRVLPRARRIEAEVVQIFPSSPRQWRPGSADPRAIRAFGEELAAAGVPLFLHTIYLINLASPDPQLRHRSARSLGDALAFGARAGAAGVVTHLGSHRGDGFEAALGRVAETVAEARARARASLADGGGTGLPPLLFEASAGGRGTVGGTPEELGSLLRAAGGEVGVCLDTAHLLAAGYAIHTEEGLTAYLRELGTDVGLDRVGLVHLNDSKTACGSRSDRHENLWEGELGRAGLGLWVGCEEFRTVPFVLETPGFGNQGPDRKNVRRAKVLRRECLGRGRGR